MDKRKPWAVARKLGELASIELTDQKREIYQGACLARSCKVRKHTATSFALRAASAAPRLVLADPSPRWCEPHQWVRRVALCRRRGHIFLSQRKRTLCGPPLSEKSGPPFPGPGTPSCTFQHRRGRSPSLSRQSSHPALPSHHQSSHHVFTRPAPFRGPTAKAGTGPHHLVECSSSHPVSGPTRAHSAIHPEVPARRWSCATPTALSLPSRRPAAKARLQSFSPAGTHTLLCPSHPSRSVPPHAGFAAPCMSPRPKHRTPADSLRPIRSSRPPRAERPLQRQEESIFQDPIWHSARESRHSAQKTRKKGGLDCCNKAKTHKPPTQVSGTEWTSQKQAITGGSHAGPGQAKKPKRQNLKERPPASSN